MFFDTDAQAQGMRQPDPETEDYRHQSASHWRRAMSEAYPGQSYFHEHNKNIRASEERAAATSENKLRELIAEMRFNVKQGSWTTGSEMQVEQWADELEALLAGPAEEQE